MNKIIFLDIDNVMIPNFEKGEEQEFDENCVGLLEYIIDKTDAKIVISSSWRHHLDNLKNNWEKAGLDWELIIGVTPSKTGGGRDLEISQWINWNKHWLQAPYSWIAIDDEFYPMTLTDLMGKLVRTETIGLTRQSAELAILKLNN